jgi:hypothetical protein
VPGSGVQSACTSYNGRGAGRGRSLLPDLTTVRLARVIPHISGGAGGGAVELPPRLETDLDRVYSELGGPAPLRDVHRSAFSGPCQKFPWKVVELALCKFQKDRDTARKHWPWAAFALDQYQFERREKEKYSSELTPAEVVDLVGGISNSARELADRLAQLQEHANRIEDPAAKFRRGHLAYLDQLIAQAAAGHMATTVNDDPEHMLRVSFAEMDFIRRLVDVETVANEGAKRVDRNFLHRGASQDDPALHNLVWRLAEVWTSMTGRKPSANKVHRQADIDRQEPDFVQFVQHLVGLVDGAPKPSRKQIQTSLNNARTP